MLNKQKQTGVYAQDQIEWDKVLVTLGGRYDWADQESYNRVLNTTAKRDDTQFTGVAALTTCSTTGNSLFQLQRIL